MPDETIVVPVEGDEGFDAGGRRGQEGGPPGRDRLVGELEVDVSAVDKPAGQRPTGMS
jgi:hypothetical protein